MEDVVVKNGKELRCGFTTGTCAAAAAAAAAGMLLTGERPDTVLVRLPGGEEVSLPVEEAAFAHGAAFCGIIKRAGDDPDVTDGMLIGAQAVLTAEAGIVISGGEGVGVVTGPGLQVPPGEAAINPVPRRMIRENVERVLARCGSDSGVQVTISARGGEEIAQKTFNPRLGIVGGISILGTTGIVEPMSEKALVDTIKVLIDKARVKDPVRAVLSPGNYGRDYCLRQFGFDIDDSIKYSNYIGETLDHLVYRGFQEILLVGHVGKLVKVAGGVMNTHSSMADCRMEILASHAALCGADRDTVAKLMACRTTDEALAVLDAAGVTQPVMEAVREKILEHIAYRTHGQLRTELVVFATGDRVLTRTAGVEAFLEKMKSRGGSPAL